jgi:hypothetical protein
MGRSLDSFFQATADEVNLHLLDVILCDLRMAAQFLPHSRLYRVKVNLPALCEINFTSDLLYQLLFFI